MIPPGQACRASDRVEVSARARATVARAVQGYAPAELWMGETEREAGYIGRRDMRYNPRLNGRA
ncbi:hypothetical protein DY245_20430 [Streptomyces inhibens]|uniref:Uncharacterized protein n=1 Tax=Streptomyces inhibens TaxID=2293571 RepID=A0A371Q2S7_STRIH|nr:hypothetical protein [Streptomyces inhibens]REK88643.1 hypothetical protein DY245_20430 [Streptomyces inhibens]